MSVTIHIGKKVNKFEVKPDDTILSLRERVAKSAGLSVHRVSLGYKADADAKKEGKKITPRRLDDKRTIRDEGLNGETALIMKDLGPQIGYRTVFIVEYLGPILIMALYALRPAFIYGDKASEEGWNPIAYAAVAAWVAHFVKREFETLFVHKFSRPTMPLSNLFKNSIYYWGFAAAVGYPLCHPLYTQPSNWNQIYVGAALMLVSELVNLAVHIQLSTMRPAEGSKVRPIPKGPLFALVSCPNYTAEVLSWVGFSIMTQIALSYVFTFVGFAQMTQWALGKHRDYIKQDPAYKKLGRTSIVPFVI